MTDQKSHPKSSNKSDDYFWREDFESFSASQVERYHKGVTDTPFNEFLYDPLLLELMEPHLPPEGGTILDAGGGTGKWAVYFAKRGYPVTLLDVAEPMLVKAREVTVAAGVAEMVTIQSGSITSLPYGDASFDMVFSDRNPISHAGPRPDSHRALGELARVLRPGGSFMASVLNKQRKAAQLVSELDLDRAAEFMATGELRRSDNGVSTYYSADELRSCATKAGLDVLALHGTTTLSEWIPTAWLLNSDVASKLRQLEMMARRDPQYTAYGVRFHILAVKK